MRFNPYGIRSIAAIALFIVGAIVLGISVHVEHSSRTVGYSTPTFTYDSFVGAFTIFFESLFVVFRMSGPNTPPSMLMVEIGYITLLSIFWIAGAIDTTLFTQEGRSVCKHLDDLFDIPEFENVDKDVLATAKKIMKEACSEMHAELAFLWIGFIIAIGTLGYIVVQALRMRSRGIPDVLRKTLHHADHVSSAPADPFADPVGTQAGGSPGLAR